MTTPIVGSPASSVDLSINQNASFTLFFTWLVKPVDVLLPGVPINLAGYSALLQITDVSNSSKVLFEASTRNGRIKLFGTTGRVEIRFSAEDTEEMKFTEGLYDLLMKAPNGDVRRPLKGRCIIDRGISKFDSNNS